MIGWQMGLACFLVSLVTVGLKGFQHKNVIGGHLKLIALTSYLMAVGDVATVGLIVKGGWGVVLYTGTGAALGMVISVKLHDRVFNQHCKEQS